MRYVRMPSVLAEVTLSVSFFLIVPEIAPRTECACHPVAFDSSSIVAPLDERNMAIRVASLFFSELRCRRVLFAGTLFAGFTLLTLCDPALELRVPSAFAVDLAAFLG